MDQILPPPPSSGQNLTFYIGAVHKLHRLRGEGGGSKLLILLSKKTTKKGGGWGGEGSKIADFETT